jgi:hypothetical protein
MCFLNEAVLPTIDLSNHESKKHACLFHDYLWAKALM